MGGGGILVRPMVPADALDIERQASQREQLGIVREMTIDEARDLTEGGRAITVVRGDRPIACLGIRETFPGVQGVAWAILSEGMGAAHFAVTRAARKLISDSPLVRIEAIVRTDAEIIWAKMVGLPPVWPLKKFGARSELHWLCERIR